MTFFASVDRRLRRFVERHFIGEIVVHSPQRYLFFRPQLPERVSVGVYVTLGYQELSVFPASEVKSCERMS